MNEHDSFRERLLSAESNSTSDPQGPLQQEIREMLSSQLSLPRKLGMSFGLIAAIASGGVCGFLALTEKNLPPLPRAGLAAGALFGLAWAVSIGWILYKGTLDLKSDTRRTAQMVWIFTVLMTVFFLMAGMSASDGIRGLMMISQALAFLIMAAVYWIGYRIEAAELSLKEQMLRLELQLTELAKNE